MLPPEEPTTTPATEARPTRRRKTAKRKRRAADTPETNATAQTRETNEARETPEAGPSSEEQPRPARRRRRPREPLPTIGWREWVGLPDLGVEAIKAKIDTGARTSALHAFDIEIMPDDGIETVYFQVHPFQHSGLSIPTHAPLAGWRRVRSSSGHQTDRPLIRTVMTWLDHEWPIELTLTNRDEMGFRMLLGRRALRRRATIDPGRSFIDRERRDLGRDLDPRARRKTRPRT